MQTKYIRFGGIPECGHSRNHMDRTPESGISCYELVRIGKEWRINGAWGSYMQSLSGDPRKCYEIAGELLAQRGSDGEPLLRNAKIVRRHRAKRLNDCWEPLSISILGATERIYRHMLTGSYWGCLSGIHGSEFRCEPAKLQMHIELYAPERAEQILSEVAS